MNRYKGTEMSNMLHVINRFNQVFARLGGEAQAVLYGESQTEHQTASRGNAGATNPFTTQAYASPADLWAETGWPANWNSRENRAPEGQYPVSPEWRGLGGSDSRLSERCAEWNRCGNGGNWNVCCDCGGSVRNCNSNCDCGGNSNCGCGCHCVGPADPAGALADFWAASAIPDQYVAENGAILFGAANGAGGCDIQHLPNSADFCLAGGHTYQVQVTVSGIPVQNLFFQLQLNCANVGTFGAIGLSGPQTATGYTFVTTLAGPASVLRVVNVSGGPLQALTGSISILQIA